MSALCTLAEREAERSSRALLIISLHADPTTVVGAPQNGGVTIYVRELARALVEDGWSVDIATRREDPHKPTFEDFGGARIIRVPAGPALHLRNDGIAEYLPQALAALRFQTITRSYAAISSHYWLSGFLGAALAGELNIPHVHTLHSLGVSRTTRDAVTSRRIEIERMLLRSAGIVTLSGDELDIYARRYGVIPPRATVIPAGVDMTRFTPGDRSQARRALDLDERGPWIGYVGRLTVEKGIDDLLRAFALLQTMTSLPRLFVVGGAQHNSRVPQLQHLAAELGIERSVRFLGPIPNRKLAPAFQAADTIAVPSHYEAFGLVALEARSCGIPVVASDVGGLRELVTPESGGCRVPARDPAALATALVQALDPRELTTRAAAARNARAARAHAWPSIARRVVDFALEGSPLYA